MKKFALILCLISLLASTTLTVFAQDTITEPGKSSTQNLIVHYTYIEGQVVLSADVTWNDLSFKYSEQGNKGVWDPVTHTYSGGTITGSFETTKKAITVTNHSNSAINITAVATMVEDATAIATLDTTATDLPTSNDIKFMGDKINDNKKEINVTMDGNISSNDDGNVVANVVVTISEKPQN